MAHIQTLVESQLQEYEKKIMEVIGEDIDDTLYECYKKSEVENELRAELREEVKQLFVKNEK